MGYFQADYGAWPAYVPVAERRRKAEREVAALRKKGPPISPVVLDGRTIATTFWGRAWCNNLESYSDYANRLERGRSYVRNGSVVDLQIAACEVRARVMGSELYQVGIDIAPLAAAPWKALIKECAGKIDSLIELLQGRFSQGVMELLTRRRKGLFPEPKEIDFWCSCPDSARLCKHIAATFYGVGARLDHEPELLFRLRRVDQLDLITGARVGEQLDKAAVSAKNKEFAGQDLSELFGIELDSGDVGSTKKSAEVAARPRAVPKSSKPARAKKSAVPAVLTRKALLARGIAPSTLQSWRRSGLLLPASERGTYQATTLVREKLAERGRP